MVITSSAILEMRELIRNENDDKVVLQGLIEYLNGTFHGHWSTYSVAILVNQSLLILHKIL